VRQDSQEGRHRGIVYIVNQLKKPEEVACLKSIYGDALLVISCHSPHETRVKSLTDKIALDHGSPASQDKWNQLATELIDKDESEKDKYGQNVRAAFPLADCIIDTQSKEETINGVSRLFRLIFGDPSLSPLYPEYGNNLAAQAALRSTDLSRQVGAAIFDGRKTVISLGSNEVPKPTGGTYWPGDDGDGRDVSAGFDINTIKKRELVIDVVQRLQNNGILKKDWDDKSHEELLAELIDGEQEVLSNARILDILEYGRALHAEMNAITDAARCNKSTQDATVFVTTFPCHNCAKHIVGAGIKEVFYLEPYPKSEVASLYPDSICIDPIPKSEGGKVIFRQFCGITTNKFQLFSKYKLKDKRGMLKPWDPEVANCLLRNNPADFARSEDIYIDQIEGALASGKLTLLER
tara:strand:- start:250 stop:1473 length:1224 start_codon:yes stop_codon:yes gene_type:complete